MKAAHWKIRSAAGLAFGAAFLYLAISGLPVHTVLSLVGSIDYVWIVAAVCFYGGDIGLRALRWWCIITSVAPLRRSEVGEAIIVGYAFNNILPARIGELARADYLHVRTGISRAIVLGSIVVERLMDGVSVTILFCIGLTAIDVSRSGAATVSGMNILLNGATVAAATFAALIFFVLMIGRCADAIATVLPRILRRTFLDVASSIAAFRLSMRVVILNFAIWIIEPAALWSISHSVGVHLTLPGVLMLTGAASLSTLVPTAPGYIGSYQYVFAICMEVFGYSRATGVIAATLVQVFLFGLLTVIGLLIYMKRSVDWLKEASRA